MLPELEQRFLACIHQRTGGKRSVQVDAAAVGQDLGLRGEQTLHVTEHLATEGLLVRGAPGPSGADMVCITPEGIDAVLMSRDADAG
jgi:hypothetical protein